MILYPAIDILAGKAVRLLTGDYRQVTEYHSNITELAQDFVRQGAQWLHCVDLDAAKTGHSDNQAVFRELIKEINIPIQLGGGIRNEKQVAEWLELGISRVILGTAAITDPGFFARCCKAYPEQIALALDIRDNKIWLAGWQRSSDDSIRSWLQRAYDFGAATVIITDISRDGTLQGPNWSLLSQLSNSSSLPIIASGGFATLNDIAELNKRPRIAGAVIGRALYEKKFSLASALVELESGG